MTYKELDLPIKSALLLSVEDHIGVSYGTGAAASSFPDFTIRPRQREWIDPSAMPDWLLGFGPRPEGAGKKPSTKRRTAPVAQRV